jgi:hypothetical protein
MKTICKMRLYKFIWVAYSQPLADTFRGCCQQTFGSPRQFPHTSAAKIRIKKGGTEPEMLTYHPQDPQNREY